MKFAAQIEAPNAALFMIRISVVGKALLAIQVTPPDYLLALRRAGFLV